METHVFTKFLEVFAIYKARGFKVVAIHTDNEYEPLRFKLLDETVQLETCARARRRTCHSHNQGA